MNLGYSAQPSDNEKQLSKAMFDSYMREIVENGGAPSI